VKGLFFLTLIQQPDNRVNIQTGVVRATVGEGHLLLAFDGKNFGFQKVVSISSLENVSFFSTQAEQQMALSELLARNKEEQPAEVMQ